MPMRQREKIQKMLRTIKDGRLSGWGDNFVLPVLSGVIMFLSFPPADIGVLAWFSLVPLLLSLRTGGLKEAFLRSALTGFVFFAYHLYWLTNVTVLGTIALVAIMLMYFACFGILARIAIKYSVDLFVIPFAWIILEYIRGNFLTGFSWGLLGYSQYQNIKLIQIADFAGAYGVSFVVAAFNSAIFGLFIKSPKKIAYLMAVLIFIVCAVMYGTYRLDNRVIWANAKVSVVQGNIPQEEKWDNKLAEDILDKYVKLTEKAAKESPDMIVWPETSYPYLVVRKEDEAPEIKDLFASVGIPILVGTVYREGERYYNSAILFDGNKEIGAIYHKMHLVPFGEYLPLVEQLSFLRKYIDKPIGDFGRGTEYTLFPLKVVRMGGEGDKRTRDTYFLKFGTLICFEDVFPYITRQFAARGANFMLNITNDAWFGETGASRQHLQASVFRAVENRIAVVRAANTGISCFIQPDGRIMNMVTGADGKDIFIEGVQTAEVEIWGRRAYYTFYGDMFVFFCAGMMIFILMVEGISMAAGKRRQAAAK